jgi:hypothetical protein
VESLLKRMTNFRDLMRYLLFLPIIITTVHGCPLIITHSIHIYIGKGDTQRIPRYPPTVL